MTRQDLLDDWKGRGIITDKNIFAAFKNVRREDFVPVDYEDEAYDDYPLPIGNEQTISQPTTVAIMTQALEPKRGQTILEVGSGSGYQAAILSEIVGAKGKIIATEIIPELAKLAEKNLERYRNVEVVHGDGCQGYKGYDFERIIVTAGCKEIPEPLIACLKEGGIIIAPVGVHSQTMIKGVKKNGKLKTEELGSFVFVPLTGEYA